VVENVFDGHAGIKPTAKARSKFGRYKRVFLECKKVTVKTDVNTEHISNALQTVVSILSNGATEVRKGVSVAALACHAT
jgi:hypothetical protein